MDKLKGTRKLSDVKVEDYDAIYLTGGHGVMFDFPQSPDLARLMAGFYEAGKVVSTVCHGATGLLSAKLSNGDHLIKGKKERHGFFVGRGSARDAREGGPFNLEEEMHKRDAHWPPSRSIATSWKTAC